mmetsp:Transcript_37553/g.80107  ORF Transcript_37553/g.80107 Transcript_37553/m.80107 type:complete len:117 (+) Transcript_37553:80-430(+)
MKVNALLLTLLTASANAQDVVEPCDEETKSVFTCLGVDPSDNVETAQNACIDCFNRKMGGSDDDNLPDDADFVDLMTNALTSCEAEEATCQACKTDLDAHAACLSAQFTLQVGQEM